MRNSRNILDLYRDIFSEHYCQETCFQNVLFYENKKITIRAKFYIFCLLVQFSFGKWCLMEPYFEISGIYPEGTLGLGKRFTEILRSSLSFSYPVFFRISILSWQITIVQIIKEVLHIFFLGPPLEILGSLSQKFNQYKTKFKS